MDNKKLIVGSTDKSVYVTELEADPEVFHFEDQLEEGKHSPPLINLIFKSVCKRTHVIQR